MSNHAAFSISGHGKVTKGIQHLKRCRGGWCLDLGGTMIPFNHRKPPVTQEHTLTRGVIVVKPRGRHDRGPRRIELMNPRGDARRAALVLVIGGVSWFRAHGTVYSVAQGRHSLLEVHEHATVELRTRAGRSFVMRFPTLDEGITCSVD